MGGSGAQARKWSCGDEPAGDRRGARARRPRRGERLVAFSLASFAGRENRAWPGARRPRRAGLSRSRYLQARDRLVRRGLVVVEAEASGRGRSSRLVLAFAESGPWWDGEVNVELLEAVLGYSAATGVARLLLAAMAAIADADGAVLDFTTGQICAAAGIAAKSYQRAKTELLGSGELVLVERRRWPREHERLGRRGPAGAGRCGGFSVPRGRVAAPLGARPLLGVAVLGCASPSRLRRAPSRTAERVVRIRRSRRRTVWDFSRSFGAEGSQVQTLSGPCGGGSPAAKGGQTKKITRALNARAGREPQNPQNRSPPTPLKGEARPTRSSSNSPFVTKRGRKRRRLVQVDLAAIRRGLGPPTRRPRRLGADPRSTRDSLGQSTFDIWLDSLELIAVDADRLVIAGPAETIDGFPPVRPPDRRCAQQDGSTAATRDEPEHVALGRDRPRHGGMLEIDQKEVL